MPTFRELYPEYYQDYLDQATMRPVGPVSSFPQFQERPDVPPGTPDESPSPGGMPTQQALRPMEQPPMPQGRDALYTSQGEPRQSTFLNIPTNLRDEYQRAGGAPRYEDINPPMGKIGRALIRLTGGNYERDYANLKFGYEAKQQHLQAQKEERAQRQAIAEANLFKALQLSLIHI